jgi:hypothetical protein
LLTKEWVQPKDAEHRLFRAVGDIKDSSGHVLVTAYAVLRPDGQWSVLLVNKDYENDHAARLVFQDSEAKKDSSFAGPVTMITFGKNQYQWHAARRNGYADPDGPAATSTITGGDNVQYTLPPASVTVLRGRIAGSGAGDK